MPHLSSKRCISFSVALCRRRRRRVGYFALPSRKIKRPLSIQFPLLARFVGRTEELFLPRHSERCPHNTRTMPSHYIRVQRLDTLTDM